MFLGQEVHNYMVFIVYYTELNFQFCNYSQNDEFVAKVANKRLTKILWPFLYVIANLQN